MRYKGALAILKDTHPALRIPSVPVKEITEDIRALAMEMSKLLGQEEALGLAAPQVGKHLQLIVIDTTSQYNNGEFLTILNPEILHEEGSIVMKEGCLSLPNKYCKIERSKKVKIKYLTLGGNYTIRELEGLEARVFLHEYDHLLGKLMTDY